MAKKKYKAVVGLDNDKTGKRFEPGDAVSEDDFTKATIKHWLKKGAIREVK